MTDANVPHRATRLSRLGRAAAWISAICCLPYLTLKVLWTVDVAVGIDDRSVLESDDWVAGNALMAVLQLAGLALVLGLTRPWAHRVPRWVLLVPVWVGTGLLFQIVVGSALMGLFSASQSSSKSTDLGGIQPWVYVTVYSSFAGQGVALAIAFASHVEARWGSMLNERTGEVVVQREAADGSWVQAHFTALATIAVELLTVVGLGCAYRAAGGSFGGSAAQPDPTVAFQLSGIVAAVTAAAGLLALLGRWGRGTKLWVPAVLTWLGSGAVAAFDGLVLVFFLLLGADDADAGWGATDTVLVVKVAIGVFAGAVGALAVMAAERHDPRRAADVDQPPEQVLTGVAR